MVDDVRQLVNRCLAGDESAVVALIDRYKGPVYGLCYRMLGHSQDAEDATQESFVRVIRSLASWNPEREFEPWLFAIAGNRCRTMLATRSRHQPPVRLVEDLPGRSTDEQQLQTLSEELHRALARLRPEYQQAFLLLHEQELSYIEISAALDCPVGTVKTWLHRARRELARELRRRGVVEELKHELR